jgi:hypothetical protein
LSNFYGKAPREVRQIAGNFEAEMKNHPQSPRDRVLWILTEHSGQMGRSRLRADTGMRYALLDPILGELAREGRIRIDEEIITLIL